MTEKSCGVCVIGCFLRDLDGHKIEAAFFDIELAKKLGLIQEATPGHF